MTEAERDELIDIALNVSIQIGRASSQGKLGISWPIVFDALKQYGDKREQKVRDEIKRIVTSTHSQSSASESEQQHRLRIAMTAEEKLEKIKAIYDTKTKNETRGFVSTTSTHARHNLDGALMDLERRG